MRHSVEQRPKVAVDQRTTPSGSLKTNQNFRLTACLLRKQVWVVPMIPSLDFCSLVWFQPKPDIAMPAELHIQGSYAPFGFSQIDIAPA